MCAQTRGAMCSIASIATKEKRATPRQVAPMTRKDLNMIAPKLAYHGRRLQTPGSCPPPPTEPRQDVSEAEERQITREVLRLLAELDQPKVRDGRIVVPDDATEELANRIRAVEGELLWALGKESGPRWGCSWVPARPPEPPWSAP